MAHHVLISEAVLNDQIRIPTYRVDFSTASSLKIRYGVIVPDTFVLLGAHGEKLQSILHPSDTELRQLLVSLSK